jgi:hypothetical protein
MAVDEEFPPFDPKALCVKCGWSIPDPVAPEPKFGPAGPDGNRPQFQAPPPPPQPPDVWYCDGVECPAFDGTGETDISEHMHQICTTCGYEWLAKPLG